MNLRKKILNRLHPILRPLSQWYLAKMRVYRHSGIVVNIYPGVFHPGFFFSTKVLLEYLKKQRLQGLKILELGAGSGLISIYCAKQGAIVTASDISKNTIACLRQNIQFNNVHVNIVLSDLFDHLNPSDYDMIVINPPYYPKDSPSEKDLAWFCGRNFEFFRKLFYQLSNTKQGIHTLMILSEDCDINQIKTLAKERGLSLRMIYKRTFAGEDNFIFHIMAE